MSDLIILGPCEVPLMLAPWGPSSDIEVSLEGAVRASRIAGTIVVPYSYLV